ncbi:hypothetical protein [Nostoc sp. NMS8]|uniref:hypothetical protein n=1 Tax=Nostoc sp. NMS8 TaxID=2815392 RepID=UPI0025F927D0|nr:hypothetical protein [Nostoc sp. NMS8]MBN3957847.1 hypothetical protein [Nostoc sp. NMS8]
MQLDPALKEEYQQLYRDCKITLLNISQIDTIINRIMDNRARYKKVERVTDVPWFIIAVIHQLEARSCVVYRHRHRTCQSTLILCDCILCNLMN